MQSRKNIVYFSAEYHNAPIGLVVVMEEKQILLKIQYHGTLKQNFPTIKLEIVV